MIVHLKRFKFIERIQRHAKLSHRVTFPLEIRVDVSILNLDYFDILIYQKPSEELYELRSVVVHLGSNANAGHYVCCVRSRETWLLFDDENVQILDQDDVLDGCFGSGSVGKGSGSNGSILGNSTGYILFYEKVEESM